MRDVSFFCPIGRLRLSAANVMPVYLSMQNPYESWELPQSTDDTSRVLRKAKRDGHDGVILMQGELGGTNYVVFRPEQIKSVISNTGEFDATNPDIRFSRQGPWYYSALATAIRSMAKITYIPMRMSNLPFVTSPGASCVVRRTIGSCPMAASPVPSIYSIAFNVSACSFSALRSSRNICRSPPR